MTSNSRHRLTILEKCLYLSGSPIVEGMSSRQPRADPSVTTCRTRIISNSIHRRRSPFSWRSFWCELWGECCWHIVHAKLQSSWLVSKVMREGKDSRWNVDGVIVGAELALDKDTFDGGNARALSPTKSCVLPIRRNRPPYSSRKSWFAGPRGPSPRMKGEFVNTQATLPKASIDTCRGEVFSTSTEFEGLGLHNCLIDTCCVLWWIDLRMRFAVDNWAYSTMTIN